MIHVSDGSRRDNSPEEEHGRSLTFKDGIELIQALPDSMYVQVIYNEFDKDTQEYMHSRHVWKNPAELRPAAAVEFIKNQFLSERSVALCVDYHTTHFDNAGKRLTGHEITFELYDEIFGIIGRQITLDQAPSRRQTVVFYERTPLPGIKNWIARKAHGERFNSLDYRVLSH